MVDQECPVPNPHRFSVPGCFWVHQIGADQSLSSASLPALVNKDTWNCAVLQKHSQGRLASPHAHTGERAPEPQVKKGGFHQELTEPQFPAGKTKQPSQSGALSPNI